MVDFLCNECGKCFEQGVNLAVHQIRTYDKRSFTCEKCGEASVGKSTYNNHMRKHTNAVAKPKALRKCDICPYETTDPTNLKKHTKNVHKEKPKGNNNPKKCHECGKTFPRKDSLDRHVKIHQKENSQESCKDCDANFSTSDDLERHVKTVHEKVKSNVGFGTFVRREKVKVTKQFLCNECSKTFNSFANLKRHFGAKRNLLRHQKSVHKASEEENTARNLDEPQNSLGLNMVNMDLNSVDLSDLLVMPFDLLPFDPLK